MTIRLPNRPSGDEYEDLTAAAVRSFGYFTETKIELRGEHNPMLEVDVVGTPAGDAFRDRILVEAKKDGCKFKYLFKVSGQRQYLGIDRGYVLSPREIAERDRPDFAEIEGGTEVECRTLSPDADDFADHLDGLLEPCVEVEPDIRGAVALAGWYAHIAQRLAYREFARYCRDHDTELTQTARDYDWATQQAFFEPEPLWRVRALYDAYAEATKLSGQFMDALAEEHDLPDSSRIKREIERTHSHLWIQYMMLLEHRARFGIVKNAMDHLLQAQEEDANEEGGLDETWALRAMMPDSFLEGMAELEDFPFRRHVPLLFQVFLEGFGGFMHLNDDRDREAIGNLCGIPSDHVEPGLLLLDRFFPAEGTDWSWFATSRDEMLWLKLVPGVVRGTGCFLRQSLFELENYRDQFAEMGWLLSHWHNALYHTLEPELGVDEGEN